MAELRTRLGRCDCLSQTRSNAIALLGHSNGVVTHWSPSVTTPLVKMLCHKGPVTAVATDWAGNYMATAGMDGQVNHRLDHRFALQNPALLTDINLSMSVSMSVSVSVSVSVCEREREIPHRKIASNLARTPNPASRTWPCPWVHATRPLYDLAARCFVSANTGVEAANAAGMRSVLVPDPNMLGSIDVEAAGATQILPSLEKFVPEDWGMPPYDK